MMGSSRLAHKANTAPLKSGAYRGTNETVEHTKRQWLALSPLIIHRQSKVARIRSLPRNTCVLQGGQVDDVQIFPTSSPISPQKVLFYTRRGQNIVKNPKFGLFFCLPGCSAFGLHHPTWPLSGWGGVGTLDTSLRPGGGVWRGYGLQSWSATSGDRTPALQLVKFWAIFINTFYRPEIQNIAQIVIWSVRIGTTC